MSQSTTDAPMQGAENGLNATPEQLLQQQQQQAAAAQPPLLPPTATTAITETQQFLHALHAQNAQQQAQHLLAQQQNAQLHQLLQAFMAQQTAQATARPGPIAAIDGRLDERVFRNCETFTGQRTKWREWRRKTLNAIRECNHTFADLLEKKERSPDPVDTDIEMTAQEANLSAVLHTRLTNITTAEAFALVESSLGNGVEAWRLLTLRCDPATDAHSNGPNPQDY